MPFKRYVEIGRVALINFGEDYGKLVVITDVVDQNRVSVYQQAWRKRGREARRKRGRGGRLEEGRHGLREGGCVLPALHGSTVSAVVAPQQQQAGGPTEDCSSLARGHGSQQQQQLQLQGPQKCSCKQQQLPMLHLLAGFGLLWATTTAVVVCSLPQSTAQSPSKITGSSAHQAGACWLPHIHSSWCVLLQQQQPQQTSAVGQSQQQQGSQHQEQLDRQQQQHISTQQLQLAKRGRDNVGADAHRTVVAVGVQL